MASEIKAKYGSVTAFTITVASLADASARQADIIDNSTSRFQKIYVFAKVKLGTSPSSNRGVFFYLIRDDGVTNVRTDNAGASDAAITIVNAQQVGALTTGPSAATGDVLRDAFVFLDPGPKWTIAVLNNSGVALDSTGANHTIEWFGENPESQ